MTAGLRVGIAQWIPDSAASGVLWSARPQPSPTPSPRRSEEVS